MVINPFTGITTANQGQLWLPTISPPASVGTTAITAQANQVRYMMVTIPFSCVIGQLTVEVTTKSASTSQKADFGLYSADGTRLILQTNAGVDVSTSITIGGFTVPVKGNGGAAAPVIIPAGNYIMAETSTDAAVACRTFAAAGISNMTGLLATKKVGIAGNAATGGILPSSLGALTSASAGNLAAIMLER